MLIFLLILFVIFCFITWGLPLLLSWLLVFKYHVQIRIGKISLLRLSFEDILIKKLTLSIKIERIGFTSSLFNQDERKLIVIQFFDVRIEKEHDSSYFANSKEQDKASNSIEDFFEAATIDEELKNCFDTIKIRIPPSIISLAQFFGVHFLNVNVMCLREKCPECLVHCSTEKLLIEGATVTDNNVAVNIQLNDAHIRLLQPHNRDVNAICGAKLTQNVENIQKSNIAYSKDFNLDPSLMDFYFSVKIYSEMKSDIHAEMVSLSVAVTSPEIIIQERLLSFLEAKAAVATPHSMSPTHHHSNIYQIVLKYWLFIPLDFRATCTGFYVKLINSNGKATAQCSLSSADLKADFNRHETSLESFPPLLLYFSIKFSLNHLNMCGLHDSSLLLHKLTLSLQCQGSSITSLVELYSFCLFYDHQDIKLWTSYFTQWKRSSIAISKKYTGREPLTLQSDDPFSFHHYCFELTFEIWNVDVSLSIPVYCKDLDSPVTTGSFNLSHARQCLKLNNGTSDISSELLIETLLAHLGSPSTASKDTNSQSASKNVHIYGTFASLGHCSLYISTNSAKECILCHFDSLKNIRFEWSNRLASFINNISSYVADIKSNIGPLKRTRPQQAQIADRKPMSISGSVNAINIFCHTNYNVSIMARIDSIQMKKSRNSLRMVSEGTKLTHFEQTGMTFPCIKSTEIQGEWADLRLLDLEYISPELHLDISKRLQLNWSTTLHMTLLTIIQDVTSFASKISRKDAQDNQHKGKISKGKIQIVAKGDVSLGAELSSQHRVDFLSGNLAFISENERLSLQTNNLKILFDKNEIFEFTGSKLLRTSSSKEASKERQSFSQLTQKENKAWEFTVDIWRTTFPYNYNFAESFSECLLSTFKWLKKLHKKKSVPFTADSPLPPDLLIKVREFSAELCDDPFEVKLRYNYELMEDEYLESCKRHKALDQKIEETRKTNVHLLSGKISNLYKALLEKNSEIYIKRSKKMYEKPMRTQLFLWKMEGVCICAMADPSFHGMDRVVKHIRDIDRESPWPDEGLEFSTLWCRMMAASCARWTFQLRDYPQPLWDLRDTDIWGRLIGAEQKPTKRAIRTVPIEIGLPWKNSEVERSLTSLKFYHDLRWESSSCVLAYGPCWEPAVSQFNLAMSLINRPSRDPSLPLPWWDKMRLLLHGRLTLAVQTMTLLLHASLDPYNTTEEMELTWNGFRMLWTNSNFIYTGDLNVFVRTASKYDDARLLHLPNLRISVKIGWVCRGNPNDHHTVMPCAPDKLPEYSSNQEHDSYRVFRSQKLKMNLVLETRHKKGESSAQPIEVLFYGSTLRWFENLKFILSGVSRPTRRGPLFKNTLPKKPQLSRHYQSVHLSLSFQRFDVRYWMSVRVRKGFHLSGERLSLSSEHSLTLASPKENQELRRRLQANWSIVYLNTELCQAQVWLQSVMAEPEEDDVNEDTASISGSSTHSINQPVEKFYFLNVTKVAYMRETLEPTFPSADTNMKDTPTHRLVVHNLKGVWTTSNRDIVFALYDSWSRNQQMKKNLSPDIIKNFSPGLSTPQKPRSWPPDPAGPLSPTSLLQVPNAVQNTPSPRSRLQSDHTAALLQQLIAEADNNSIAYAEDCSNPQPRDQALQGIKAACTTDDVIHKTWLIELVNSQVLLKGCETKGYVIISAAHSQISQRIHRPNWKDHSLMAKTTWSGSLECMQYYATVNEGSQESEIDNIMWLTLDNIEEKENTIINEVTDIVGSGQSAGGVVTQTVGMSNLENDSLQLQRIVSRCRCEFFYVSYAETCIDQSLLEEVAPPPYEEDLWNNTKEASDTFTLIHYDVCACTNYLQYSMVVDILNNLLLYIDPRKKQASGALARMRLKLQLYSSEDQRKPVLSLQNQLRYHLSQLRFLEKEIYLVQRQMDKRMSEDLLAQRNSLESQVSECKEKVTNLSDELAIRIHCFNETQLSANKKLSASKGNGKEQSLIRMNEVYFRKAQWRLTESDGQLSIAQLDLSNFLYSKKTFSTDNAEHLLELGFIHMSNLLPNQLYKDVLTPAELRSSMPVDRQKTLRIYCREKPPIGGISIIEHFEINVVPLKIGLTYQFFKTMMKFCFPNNNPEEEAGMKKPSSHNQKKGSKVSNFYVDLHKDEVEIMKQRADQNKLFVFIKIPELPVQVSYKGKKEKNIEDVDKYHLVVPMLEYHSVTWTWLDLLMAIKQSSKSALLSQAIKHKLNLGHFRTDEQSTPTEEDKARLLLGTRHLPAESKGLKKSLFKFAR